MAEFLLELLSEEIPARMQKNAREDLGWRLPDDLSKVDFPMPIDVKVYSTPRRLVLHVKDMIDATEAMIEEHKGPRTGSPQQAIDGFLRKTGKTKEDLYERGGYNFVKVENKSRATKEILEEVLPELIRTFPWQKSMLWGDGDLRWARPLHSILALFDGKPLVFEVGGITSGNTTRLALNDPTPIKISSFDDYCAKLKKAGIIIDHKERRKKILADAKALPKERGSVLVEDESLIDELADLVESPFCIMGYVGREFLEFPPEILQTSMKTHQKFLSVRYSDKTDEIAFFITVADKHKPSESAQETIFDGNQRVLSARLADAKFFWENDLRIVKEGMKPWIAGLEKMTFHNKLGTQADRVKRIAAFAKSYAHLLGKGGDWVETTAKLMKLDLCSEMVGEFPELQGTMGAYYVQHAGHNAIIAQACEQHYAPLGLKDESPSVPLCVLMALADKLDTLAGFWAVGVTPTSSKDPFALRRAALGVIRLILDNRSRHSLQEFIASASKPFKKPEPKAQENLLTFFQDRLKIYLREKEGIQPDTIDACLLGELPDDLTFLYNRARALQDFRQTPECENLVQGFKRAHNILTAEQKKDGVFYEMPPESQYFQDPTEGTLFKALEAAEKELPKLLEAEKFPEMLKTLAKLRTPIDTFFEAVQVNSEVEIVRRNRLCLLHKICSTMKTFADFSLLNG